MPAIKDRIEAATERPEPTVKEPWQIDRERILNEDAQVEAYAQEHHCTEQEARLAVRDRRLAAELMPAAIAKLGQREGKAAHEIETVEGERERLQRTAGEWNDMGKKRAEVQVLLSKLNGLHVMLSGMV